MAEQFGKTSGMKTPVVESTGTGGGFKLFCAGVGEDHPDFTNASRAIKKGEFEDCAKNGVTEIVEIKVGFDGLALADSTKGADMKLTKQQIFMALAKQVPDKDGKLVPNPYTMWNEIDPSLPAQKIEVYGPPPTSGTRDSFMELVMEKGAEAFDSLKELKKSDAKAFEAVWKSMREDGAFVEAGENDNLIVQKLVGNPNAIGIFGFANVAENARDPAPWRSTASCRPSRPSRRASTRWPARCSSMPRSSMSASFPAWPSSWPSTPPRRPSAKRAISPTRA